MSINKPNIVYILQSKRPGETWKTCWGALLGDDAYLAKKVTEHFNEESVGIKFRARPFIELHPIKTFWETV